MCEECTHYFWDGEEELCWIKRGDPHIGPADSTSSSSHFIGRKTETCGKRVCLRRTAPKSKCEKMVIIEGESSSNKSDCFSPLCYKMKVKVPVSVAVAATTSSKRIRHTITQFFWACGSSSHQSGGSIPSFALRGTVVKDSDKVNKEGGGGEAERYSYHKEGEEANQQNSSNFASREVSRARVNMSPDSVPRTVSPLTDSVQSRTVSPLTIVVAVLGFATVLFGVSYFVQLIHTRRQMSRMEMNLVRRRLKLSTSTDQNTSSL